jgi:spore coat polysaccharide biosynthesis protein SpsF (cytidylyltransferase family)
MFMLNKNLFMCAVVAGFAVSSNVSAEEVLSDEALRKAYEKAAEAYAEEHPAKPVYTAPVEDEISTEPNEATLEKPKMLDESQDVAMISPEAEMFHNFHRAADYLPLNNIRIAVDVENRALKEVVSDIVAYAEEKSGPWKVKWRMSPENRHILNSRVNLTAETTFEDFMDHLVDRINNMTGVRLSVNVFDMSRIIVISDSY